MYMTIEDDMFTIIEEFTCIFLDQMARLHHLMNTSQDLSDQMEMVVVSDLMVVSVLAAVLDPAVLAALQVITSIPFPIYNMHIY